MADEERKGAVKRVPFSVLALVLVFTGALSHPADARADTRSHGSCEALVKADFESLQDAPTQVMTAQHVAATEQAGAHCLVHGYVSPSVGFDLRLPDSWNGKFLELGCGGLCGSTHLPMEMAWCLEAVRRGYACILSDRGHMTGEEGGGDAARDGVWAYHNLLAKIDYGYLAAHVAALAGKAITARYYGVAPRYSYFLGCSGGGRQGLTEAQLYPWDFDGIVAIAPGPGVTWGHMTLLWDKLVSRKPDGSPIFSAADVAVLHAGALAACDKLDGTEDGIIDDPRRCQFDPAKLLCKGPKTPNCLSKAEVEAARKIYSGPTNSKGERLYYGAMPGSEEGSAFFGSNYSVEFFRYMGFFPEPGPTWQAKDFNYDQDYKRFGTMGAIYDAGDPDLQWFQKTGGKLLIVQGWQDSGSPLPLSTIHYYDMVEAVMGGLARTRSFARLFMVPGFDHCIGGPGPNCVDYLHVMEDWREKGHAPHVLVMRHINSRNPAAYIGFPAQDAVPTAVRPIFPYPDISKYTGGDWRKPESYKRARSEPRRAASLNLGND